MRIMFLSPRLPPESCGVADHTVRLARALARRGVQTGFIHRWGEVNGDLPDPTVVRWDGTPKGLYKLVEVHRPEWLWLQLSGYGFSRWGAPFRLGQALTGLRDRLGELRIVTFAHETHCSPGQLGWKGHFLSSWQRHTVGRIAALSDVLFFSNLGSLEHALRSYPITSAKAVLLPIGSNIPSLLASDEEIRLHRAMRGWAEDKIIAMVFGSWGMQYRTLRKHLELLRWSLANARLHRVVCVGGGRGDAEDGLRELTRRNDLDTKVDVLGPREASEVAQILQCGDVGLAQPDRQILAKSGGFMAMAGNGLPVIVCGDGDPGYGLATCRGCISPEEFRSSQMSRDMLHRRGQELLQLAEAQFDWNAIAETAIDQLMNH